MAIIIRKINIVGNVDILLNNDKSLLFNVALRLPLSIEKIGKIRGYGTCEFTNDKSIILSFVTERNELVQLIIQKLLVKNQLLLKIKKSAKKGILLFSVNDSDDDFLLPVNTKLNPVEVLKNIRN